MTARLAICFVFLMLPAPAWAFTAPTVHSGNQAYSREDYAGAAQKYEQALKKDPESAIINFNLGTAYYKQGEWGKAAEHLQKALLADDPDLRARAHYNLGNTFRQAGVEVEDRNLDVAEASLEESLSHFKEAIAIHPSDQDAISNQALVFKELEELKKKKPPKKSGLGGQPQSSPGQDQKENSDETSSDKNQDQKGDGDRPPDSPPSADKNQEQRGDGQQNQTPPSTGSDTSSDQGPHDRNQEASGEDQSPRGGASLSTDAAEQLLNEYQQTEEPKGLPKFFKRSANEPPVLKDW